MSIYLCLKRSGCWNRFKSWKFRSEEQRGTPGRGLCKALKVGTPKHRKWEDQCCDRRPTEAHKVGWYTFLFGLWFPSSSHSEMDRDSPDGKFFSLAVLIRGYEELLISTTREILVFFLNWTWKRNGVISAETVMLQFPLHSSGPCKLSSDEE